MKINCLTVSFFFMLLESFCQTQWTKYTGNPVLSKGPSNNDIIGIGQPTCLIENDTIKMWYVGVGNDMKARICYATSVDGINWDKFNNGNPVLNAGNPGEWDCGWLDAPEIAKGPNGYLLLYYGDTVQQSPEINSAYGAATSPDGINWTKYTGNPVFTKGNSSEWDGKWIEAPAVIFDSAASVFKMWYTGANNSNWMMRIGYATSPDGFSWTKHSGNPVLTEGGSGSFDDMWVAVPAVLKKEGQYQLWYSAFSSVSGFDTLRIGFATSSDGISWAKHPDNPLLSTFSPPYDSLIDDGGPWAPEVIFDADSGIYKMWFEASGGFLFASSPEITVGYPFAENNVPGAFSIYPNPAANALSIELVNGRAFSYSGTQIKVFNIAGQEVLSSSLTGIKTEIQTDLPAGIYTLQIKNVKFTLTKTIEIIP